ncbi:MAG TPA: carboxypeptidase regulatory-like domain-containing protein [Vicinamibacterales bacterium]|jgi:plastocyanin
MSQGLRLLAALSVLLAAANAMIARPAVGQRTGADPTGNIRGRVEIQRALTTSERRPSVSDLGMPPRRDRPDRMDSVIYLENAPAGAFEERPAGRARMTQRNETFLPYVLAIRGGTTVDFPNEDQTYHNVFSLSKVRRFDLGRYAAGKTKQVRFDQPGIVRVFCDIHSHMSAFILVFNHQFFDTTNADGRYNIPTVPPGKYTVNAWNDGEVRDSRTVVVPEHGGTVEVDFALR